MSEIISSKEAIDILMPHLQKAARLLAENVEKKIVEQLALKKIELKEIKKGSAKHEA